jgi:hypothetical protein
MNVSTFFFPFSKIFILNDLPGTDPMGSVQNLEPQGLTAKIFQNKDLDWWQSRPIFFVRITKILILNDLRSLDRYGSGQDLEPQGLTRKIFWNKDLPASEGSFRPSKLGHLSKIFILNDLLGRYRRESAQDLEP